MGQGGGLEESRMAAQSKVQLLQGLGRPANTRGCNWPPSRHWPSMALSDKPTTQPSKVTCTL